MTGSKTNLFKPWEVVAVQSEEVMKRSQQPDRAQPNLNNRDNPSKKQQDLVKLRKIQRFPSPHNHPRWLLAVWGHDPHSHMLLNAGRLSQHIGKVLPPSGSGDLKRTAVKSVGSQYLSSLRGR